MDNQGRMEPCYKCLDMPQHNGSQLKNRKPFKLLAQFEEDELELITKDLRHLIATTSGRLYPKLLQYVERWRVVKAKTQPLTRAQFVDGTDLPVSANSFDKLTSRLYNYLQEFLARQELIRNPVAVQQLAFRSYRTRPLDWNEIHRRHGEAHRELDKLPQSSRLSHSRLILDLDLATMNSDRNIPPKERGYTELLAALEADYVTQKLRLLCAIANDRKIFEAPVPDLSISMTLPPFRQSWPPLARMYYGVYQLLTGEDSRTSMASLRSLFDEQDVDAPTYPRDDLLDLYGYLLNGLTRKVNQGDSIALKELSLIYDHLLAKDILIENGQIAAGHFKNMISVKLKNEEVEGARRVFEQLAGTIANDPDKNAVRYNHTQVLYAEQHLAKAAKELEELCAQTNNLRLDLFYGLDMRANLLKIYFDLLKKSEANHLVWDETDEKMIRLLDSFKGYIARKKLPDHRRQSYESFRKLIQALYNAAYRQSLDSDEELRELENEIRNSSGMYKKWLEKRWELIVPKGWGGDS